MLKIANCSHLSVLTPPLKEFRLKSVTAVTPKIVMPLYQVVEGFDDICICFDTIPDCDWQTDRRTDLPLRIGMLSAINYTGGSFTLDVCAVWDGLQNPRRSVRRARQRTRLCRRAIRLPSHVRIRCVQQVNVTLFSVPDRRRSAVELNVQLHGQYAESLPPCDV